jgi:hypothetical protein
MLPSLYWQLAQAKVCNAEPPGWVQTRRGQGAQSRGGVCGGGAAPNACQGEVEGEQVGPHANSRVDIQCVIDSSITLVFLLLRQVDDAEAGAQIMILRQ